MARRTVNLTQNGLVVVVPESPERVDRQRLFQSYRVGNLRMAMEECHYPAGAGGPINENSTSGPSRIWPKLSRDTSLS